MKQDLPQSQSQSRAREDLCRFLAACYYEPTTEFAETRLFESVHAAAADIDPAMAEAALRLGDAFSAESLQDLAIDHTRLFLGPVRALAMPYGSVWLAGDTRLMQDSTLAVQALYAQGGFDIGDDLGELPDHIAVELEFLYLLLFTEREALARGDTEDAALAGTLRQRLITEHLGVWVAPFCDAVRRNAETAFYRELAELTERWIRGEVEALRAQPLPRA